MPVPSIAAPKVLVVGGKTGRVGRALVALIPEARPVGRGDLQAAVSGGAGASEGRELLLVAVTNNALEQVITDCPPARRPDLLFLQNGMLLPLLERHGLAANTQALLYLSASADGTVTDAGKTAVCGRDADAFAALLRGGGLACRAVEPQTYLALMTEKLLWASTYWLLSAALGGMPVGQVATQHGDDVAELVAEMLPLAQAYLVDAAVRLRLGSTEQVEALTVDGVCASMADYSLSIPTAVPSRQMAVAEFAWRNGWFLQQRRTPAHHTWLQRAGVGERVA